MAGMLQNLAQAPCPPDRIIGGAAALQEGLQKWLGGQGDQSTVTLLT